MIEPLREHEYTVANPAGLCGTEADQNERGPPVARSIVALDSRTFGALLGCSYLRRLTGVEHTVNYATAGQAIPKISHGSDTAASSVTR